MLRLPPFDEMKGRSIPETLKRYLEDFKGDLERMKQDVPDAVKGFGGLFQKMMADGALPTK